MSDGDWQESLFDYLISFGVDKTIRPAEMIYFLMGFCGNCVDPSCDEEDVRILTKMFYDIVREIIKTKKNVVQSD